MSDAIADAPRRRYHPVPVPQWWIAEVRAAAKRRDLDQFAIAELAARHLDRKRMVWGECGDR